MRALAKKYSCMISSKLGLASVFAGWSHYFSEESSLSMMIAGLPLFLMSEIGVEYYQNQFQRENISSSLAENLLRIESANLENTQITTDDILSYMHKILLGLESALVGGIAVELGLTADQSELAAEFKKILIPVVAFILMSKALINGIHVVRGKIGCKQRIYQMMTYPCLNLVQVALLLANYAGATSALIGYGGAAVTSVGQASLCAFGIARQFCLLKQSDDHSLTSAHDLDITPIMSSQLAQPSNSMVPSGSILSGLQHSTSGSLR